MLSRLKLHFRNDKLSALVFHCDANRPDGTAAVRKPHNPYQK